MVHITKTCTPHMKGSASLRAREAIKSYLVLAGCCCSFFVEKNVKFQYDICYADDACRMCVVQCTIVCGL